MRDEQINNILSQLSMKCETTSSHSSILSDLNRTKLVFDGESGDSEMATEWLTALTTTSHLNRWPDSYMLEAARSHLSGSAKNWSLSHQSELTTWEQFSKQFKEMFVASEGIADLWK